MTEGVEQLERDANPVYKSFENCSPAVRTIMASECLGPEGDEKKRITTGVAAVLFFKNQSLSIHQF